MKRASMLRGPRRSAKQTVIDFSINLTCMLDTPGLPPDRRKEFRNHLGAVLQISQRMNWTDITTRVTNYIRSNPIDHEGVTPLTKRGVFTEPE